MRLHRFYVSQPLGEEVVIDDVSLVSQLTKVFRYTQGDNIILFNGDGDDYYYSITDLTKNTLVCIRTKTTPSYIPTQKILLCMSVIKKDTFELVVQKATELGVTTITPIISSRSEKKNLSYERLRKIAIESAEQCGRGDIPTISPIMTLEAALSSLSQESYNIMFTMGEKPLLPLPHDIKGTHLALFIGPEGGWGDADTMLMKKAGLHAHSLGKTTLRAETAAISACALLSIV